MHPKTNKNAFRDRYIEVLISFSILAVLAILLLRMKSLRYEMQLPIGQAQLSCQVQYSSSSEDQNFEFL